MSLALMYDKKLVPGPHYLEATKRFSCKTRKLFRPSWLPPGLILTDGDRSNAIKRSLSIAY